MTSYKHRIATVAPPTLEKRLEALRAARTLLAQEDEFARRRREEIAALRRDFGELVVAVQELCFLEPIQPLAGTCRYWCHGGFLLDKQRNLGLGCPAIVLEPG
jgi:hypothetical protein